MNENKTSLEARPFFKDHTWIPELKKLNNEIRDLLFFDENTVKKKNFITYTIYSVSRITHKFKSLLTDYNTQHDPLISYFITVLASDLDKAINKYDPKKERNSIDHKKYYTYKEALIKRIEHILDVFQLALLFSPKAHNILKFCNISLELIKFDESFENLLFKKSYQMLDYPAEISTEMLNIIVFLKFIKRDLSEEILSKTLNNLEYLNLAVVSFYLSSDSRRNKFVKTKTRINNHINTFCKDLDKILPNKPSEEKSKDALKHILKSQKIVILSDFLGCPIIFSSNKKAIKDLFDRIRLHLEFINDFDKSIYNLFAEYILGEYAGFIEWNFREKDVQEETQSRIKKKRIKGYA